MPGAYAHITLVNMLRETARLDSLPAFPKDAKVALMRNFKFCELGAVSPDYPYLAITDKTAAKWADLMHYEHTGDIIVAGVRRVAAMPAGDSRNKALAWLLGYSAHVAADVTIHPIVELKVGTYAEHKTDHRVCEMNQDAYIFQRLNLGAIGLAEHLDAGIWACCGKPSSGYLDPVISTLWKDILKDCHAGQYAATPPDPDRWHAGFRGVVDKIEEGGMLFPAARHLAVDSGFTYPNPEEVDSQYISNLRVPGINGVMHYDAIFDRAINNTLNVWATVASGVLSKSKDYLAVFENWNLDTGRNSADKFAFWS
jgi:hypothetical protein